MTGQKGADSNVKQEIIEKINKIVFLKIKTLIVRNLKKEDVSEFEQVVKNGNSNLLLAFAHKKFPDLSTKIYKEMKLLGQKFSQPAYV